MDVMKHLMITACCVLAAGGSQGRVTLHDEAERVPSQSRLATLSAGPGESRTYRVDLPADARQIRVQIEDGWGPLGVHVRSPSGSRECFTRPSDERGLICILGWSPGNEPRSYLVTLNAAADNGYEDVDLRIHHEPMILLNGVAWGDIDPTMLGSAGFRFSLEGPGPLAVRTMGGTGNVAMTVIHDDGSFGGKRVCESTEGGTSHRCHLPVASAGSYRVVLRGEFRDLGLLATWK
jgi:hypothetical protein